MLTRPARPARLDLVKLRAAIDVANVPTLLMILFQLTGNRQWLSGSFRPSRPKAMEDHDSGGLSTELQERIRSGAFAAISDWAAGVTIRVPCPRHDLLLELLSVCVGERVAAEYEPMLAEQMGFTESKQISSPPTTRHANNFSVLVIGAGIGGLTAALKLKEAGIRHVVLERSESFGGVWRNNAYPGAGVDVPSYLYSFSFFPKIWSRYFAKRDQVLGYIKDIVDHFNLAPALRFGVEVMSAVWYEEEQTWKVKARTTTGKEQEYTANALISAVGVFSHPKIPQIKGMDTFQGPLFHTARWPEDVSVAGKAVSIIGTGASAQQIVPAIADIAKSVTIYQRSAQWVCPVPNYLDEVGTDKSWLIENVPFYHAWYLFRLAWTFNDKLHPSLQVDPNWPHADRSINAKNDKHREYLTDYMRNQLEGREDLLAKTLPAYPPYGKRMLLDNGWFEALKRPNVELVTDRIASIDQQGIVDSLGKARPSDLIVLSTGFEAQRFLHKLDIRGRSGRRLHDVWEDDNARAYLGITAPGFPNLFFVYGPNTNGSGGTYFGLAEQQVGYIVSLIASMVNRNIGAIEPRQEIHDEYNRQVDAAHEGMIWSHANLSTYYRNERGRVVVNMPWRVLDYWNLTRQPNLADFNMEPCLNDLAYRKTS